MPVTEQWIHDRQKQHSLTKTGIIPVSKDHSSTPPATGWLNASQWLHHMQSSIAKSVGDVHNEQKCALLVCLSNRAPNAHGHASMDAMVQRPRSMLLIDLLLRHMIVTCTGNSC